MKEFQPIANLLAGLLAGRLSAQGDAPAGHDAQRQLARIWYRLADAAIHCQPLLFASGRLVVFTESAAWGNEIRHHAPRLRKALAAHGVKVSAIEVKIRPVSPLPPARKTRTPAQLPAAGAERIAALAASVQHPRLRQSLFGLARRAGGRNPRAKSAT